MTHKANSGTFTKGSPHARDCGRKGGKARGTITWRSDLSFSNEDADAVLFLLNLNSSTPSK